MHGHYRFINPAVRTTQAVPIIYNEENVKKKNLKNGAAQRTFYEVIHCYEIQREFNH